jgi:hypothetical protein
MLNYIFLLISSKRNLLKLIKNDNYKNWETHFDNYNKKTSKKANPIKLKTLGLEVYKQNLKEVIRDYSITDLEKSELVKIKSFFQLSEESIKKIKAKYARSAVNEFSKMKLIDKQLTDDEVGEIEAFAKELDISPHEVKKINQRNAADLYQTALKQIVSDKLVTYQEQEQLKDLAVQLRISQTEIGIDRKLRNNYDFLVLMNALDHGYLPQVKSPSIVLQKSETAYLEIKAELLVSKVVTTGYSRGNRGVSIRVMKGLSYRVGSSRSTPITQQVDTKFAGVFAITSKRVVFAASQKAFSIPFSQLISFVPYSDGIALQKNNKERMLQFSDSNTAEIANKILANAINEAFSTSSLNIVEDRGTFS